MKKTPLVLVVAFTLFFEFFFSVDVGFSIDSRFDPIKNIDSLRYLVLPVLCFFLTLLLFESLIAFVCWLAVGGERAGSSKVALFACYYLLIKFSLIAYSSLVFPYSRVGRLLDPSPGLAYALFFLSGVVALKGVLAGLGKVASLKSQRFIAFGLFFIFLPVLTFSFNYASDEQTSSEKNIILLGVDSVSPRHFHDERDFSKVMPVMHRYLTGGMVYEHAYTPLARTYPAWASILTGLYPRDSGVIFNLVEASTDVKSLSLPAVLNDYHSVYAMDERRFSMVDESWGFDEIVGPDAGVADFFVDKFRTLASVNFIHSVPWLSHLLPFVNNNRAYDDIYMPGRFSESVRKSIGRVNGKPLFFALHLCLAHYPYNLSDFSRSDAGDSWHKQLLGRLDLQFSDIMHSLQVSGVLDNAIVIIFSDHGESLRINDNEHHAFADVEGFENHKGVWSTPSGHGSSLLRQDQTEVLLSISVFEDGKIINQGTSSDLATLSDIYPTILDYVGKSLPSKYPEFCGALCKLGVKSIDLTALRDNPDRWIFMETGLSFSFLSGLVDLSSEELEEALSDIASESYEIGENGKFAVMKSEWMQKFEKSKSFAFLSRNQFIYSASDFDALYVLDKDKGTLNKCNVAIKCEEYDVKREFFEFIQGLRG